MQFLATSYLTKAFSLDQFSLYALILSICSPVFLLLNMNIRVLISTQGNHFSNFGFNLFRQLSLLLGFCITLVVASGLFGIQTYLLVFVLAAFRAFDGVFEWSYGYFLKKEQASAIGKSQIFRGIALGLPIVIGLFYTLSMEVFFSVVLLGLLVVFLVSDLRPELKLPKLSRSHFSEIRNILYVGFPLGLVALFDSLCIQIPKYGLEWSNFSELVGVFTSLFVFLQTMSYLGFAVVNSTLPSLAGYIKKSNTAAISNIVRKSSLIMLLITLAFVTTMYWFGEQILALAYTEEIAQYSKYFIIMCTFTLPMQLTMIYAYVLYAAGKFRTYLSISLIAAVCTLILTFWLVPKFSILGAIYAFGSAMWIKCIVVGIVYFVIKAKLNRA